jgi:hypothetical protein
VNGLEISWLLDQTPCKCQANCLKAGKLGGWEAKEKMKVRRWKAEKKEVEKLGR